MPSAHCDELAPAKSGVDLDQYHQAPAGWDLGQETLEVLGRRSRPGLADGLGQLGGCARGEREDPVADSTLEDRLEHRVELPCRGGDRPSVSAVEIHDATADGETCSGVTSRLRKRPVDVSLT